MVDGEMIPKKHVEGKFDNFNTRTPVIYGRVCLVPCKKRLVQCTLLYTCTQESHFLQNTIATFNPVLNNIRYLWAGAENEVLIKDYSQII